MNTFVKETLQCVHSLNLERDYRTIVSVEKSPVRIINETPVQFKYRSLLTKFAYTHFFEETEKIDRIHFSGEMDGCYLLKNREISSQLVFANEKNCGCRFFETMSLPCRHIIYFLRRKQLEEFVPDLCHQRWRKSNLPVELFGETIPATVAANRTLSQNEKFRKAHDVTQKIAELLSEKPMAIFETFINAIRKCRAAIENDQLFVIENVNENGKILMTDP